MRYLLTPWGFLLVILVLLGPTIVATSHLLLFSKESPMGKMRLASRFMVGFDAYWESWRYLMRGCKLD
jgi:hypothetical protein